jgi:hypothetical protein
MLCEDVVTCFLVRGGGVCGVVLPNARLNFHSGFIGRKFDEYLTVS